MAWDERGYYYRSERDGKNVRRSYIGRGHAAAVAASDGQSEHPQHVTETARIFLTEDAGRLRQLLTHGDFAGLREQAALARLPEAERPRWQALRADADAVLTGAGQGARLAP
jgi:hypothetical protein